MPKQITRNRSLQQYCVYTVPKDPQCECGRLTLEGRAEMDSQSLLQPSCVSIPYIKCLRVSLGRTHAS